MMSSAEVLLRYVIGLSSNDIRAMALSIEEIMHLLFSENIAMDDIRLTKDVYPAVAKIMGKRHIAVSRQVERLSILCWDAIAERNLSAQIIGIETRKAQRATDILFHFAFLLHFRRPFYEVVGQRPDFLFGTSDRVALRTNDL